MAKAIKTNKTTKTNTTNKTNKAESKLMTYPQACALTNALFHSDKTKAQLCEMIDKVAEGNKNAMKPEAKAKWLEKAGQEHCSYGQCKMYAFTLLKRKADYNQVSAIIATLDSKNGYVRKPKETTEKVVEKANEKAKEVAPKGKKPSAKKAQKQA